MHAHFYRRKLPHWQPAEATFFITFRLNGSIPKSVIKSIESNFLRLQTKILNAPFLYPAIKSQYLEKEKKRLFVKQDEFLDQNPNAPYWLKMPEIAKILMAEILIRSPKWYKVWAVCIMPNHVHLLITLEPGAPVLFRVLQSIKSFSARKANQVLKRTGPFWELESYDHIVRNTDAFLRITKYILHNPVKANFVKKWEDWRFTYLNPDIYHHFSLIPAP
ncbi:MAG: transposase [Saprospiraceae bacterium]|nr:transposase [Saprospiraceae bacterium]